MHLRFRLAVFGAVAVLTAACSSDNGGALVTPRTHYNLALEVTPASLPTINEDDSAMFDVVVRDVDTKLVVPNPDGFAVEPNDDNVTVSVDDNGHFWVHAVGPNSSSLTASFKNMNKDSTVTLAIPVTITPVPVGSVTIDSATYTGDTVATALTAGAPIALYSDTVNGGDQITLQATVVGTSSNPLPARRRVWSSANDSVATVDADGLVTAVGPGSTQIIATADGVADSVTVNVATRPVDSVAVAPSTATLAVGGTVQLTATAKAANGSKLPDRKITWTTDLPVIAVVSNDGLVTATGTGTAHITATVEGKSAVATITVQ